MNKRTISRMIAVQCSYQADLNDQSNDLKVVFQDVMKMQTEKYTENCDEDFVQFLLSHSQQNKDKIQNIIRARINKDWTFSRMDLVLINIIMLAVCEFLYYPELAVNIIIDEYVTVSSLFLKTEEINFVNAILSNIAKDVRKESDTKMQKKIETNEYNITA